jgi:hypothetical protein
VKPNTPAMMAKTYVENLAPLPDDCLRERLELSICCRQNLK